MSVLRRPALINLIALASVTGAGAQEDPQQLLKRIASDWAHRRDAVQSIRVELSGMEFHPSGSYDVRCFEEDSRARLKELGHIPPNDTENPLSTRLLFDFGKNRARKDLDHMVMYLNAGKFVRRKTSHLFDGRQIRVYEPRDKNKDSRPTYQPDVIYQVREFGSGFFGNEDHPAFWGCGVVWTSAAKLEKLKKTVDVERFSLIGYTEVQGKRCVVLRSGNLLPGAELFYEYCIDIERESSVLRSQIIENGRVGQQIDAEWQVRDKRLFPIHWRYSEYVPMETGQPSKLGCSFDVTVDRVIFNPVINDSEFGVALKPGMIVADVGERVSGVVGPEGKALLPLSEANSVRRRMALRSTALWIVMVVVGLIAGFYIRYRWKARSRQP